MLVTFSGTLLRFVNFQKQVSIDANTVSEALAGIASKFPQAKSVIYDGDLNIRRVHQIFVNGKHVGPDEIDTPLAPSDRMDLLTAIAGG